MGGPKDEEPPVLLSMNPENESRNVNPSIIELVFNEFIAVDNPNKNILITPRIDKDEMEVVANKRTVTIKLNQDLEENTTYVFNFQKSIQDITEKNTPENLKLVFSTGPDIDSLRFSGNVKYIFPQKDKNIKDVLVGLYEVTDTTNVLTAPPYYTIQTDSSGNFQFTNLKGGKYFTYAWFDGNNTLKAEDKTEPYGFILDTLVLDKDISGAQFYLSLADLSELKINRASSTGSNFDVVLSKNPAELIVEHPDLNQDIYYRLNEKNLRFYSKKHANDSTAIRLIVKDSVGFSIDTTFYAKFVESDRTKEKLEVTTGNRPFIRTMQGEFNFNKPLLQVKFDSLYLAYDSASVIPIDASMLSFQDSLTRRKLLIRYTPVDTMAVENFRLIAKDSTFFDIDGMTNDKELTINFRKVKPDILADGFTITVKTDELPIILQILSTRGEVIHERYLEETNKTTFNQIEAGTYNIRAIIDRNKNRRWDTSNYLEGRQAEPVYYMKSPDPEKPLEIMIKAGWELDLPIEPTREVGLGKVTKTEEEVSEEGEENEGKTEEIEEEGE
ncbi:MAG: Ig-like domain-containing domain [Mongoliitalea sp.]